MTSDPTNVGHACEFVVWVDVEHILDGQSSTEEIASSRVNDSFWLAR